MILDPIDARSSYRSPGDELRQEAEALTLATSLIPDRVNENPFFTEGPRRIFAHLLTFRPTAEELAAWLCHDEELDRRVHGTPYASIIDRQAPAQRRGVFAALNMVADALKPLPRESRTTRRWSASSWARDRRGWLFLTSTPETRTGLVPLTRLWLDMLVLRLPSLSGSFMTSTIMVKEEALKGRANRQKTVAEQIRPNVSRRPLRRELLDRPSRDKPIWQRRKTR